MDVQRNHFKLQHVQSIDQQMSLMTSGSFTSLRIESFLLLYHPQPKAVIKGFSKIHKLLKLNFIGFRAESIFTSYL